MARDITQRVGTRPWTDPGRALQSLARLEVGSLKELEPNVLASIRRMAAKSRQRRSPMARLLRKAGLVPTEADVAFAMLQNWRKLSESGRQVVARTIPTEMVAAAMVWLDSGAGDRATDVIDAIAACPARESAAVFERLLRSPQASIREVAFNHFADVVRREGAGCEPIDDVLARLFEEGPDLADRGALACVLQAIRRPGPALAARLADEGHPSHLLLRSLVRSGPHRPEGRQLVELLAAPSVRPAARDAIERTTNPEEIAAILAGSHLLLTPERRRLLSNRKWLRVVLGATSAESAWRDFPRLLETSGIFFDGGSIPDLAPIIVRGGREARATLALRIAVCRRPDGTVSAALRDLCFDADVRIARRAMLSMSESTCAEMDDVARRNLRSPHVMNRVIAEQWARECDLRAALQSFDPFQGGVSIRRHLHENRDATVHVIRDSIQCGPADHRIRAMQWARRMGLTLACELELLAAVTSESDSVVATAVLALAGTPTDAARQATVACLTHRDARVRANAVESLARRGEGEGLNAEFGLSPDPRVRANVARAFLCSRDSARRQVGVRILDHMVDDERPEHRRSALWLTERLARTEAAQVVATMATRDAAMPVRHRAKRAARRLLAEMRADIHVRLASPGRATSTAGHTG